MKAFRFFRAQPAIERKLKMLLDVSLDYLRLGQALETLAGGECQRVKLAGQLASSRKTGVLFLLIEPAAGLHPADVANLLECFERLLAAGHSLIVIEHDLDVISSADCVIDLDSGRIVAQGTPEEVAPVAESLTGQRLKNSARIAIAEKQGANTSPKRKRGRSIPRLRFGLVCCEFAHG